MPRSSRLPARILALGAVFAITVTTIACAGGPRGGPGGGPREAPPRTAMFISPFGEPFMAEPGQPWPTSDWFLGADRDLDGAITFEEFTADGVRWFGQLDQDRNGRLEQAELAAYEARLRTLAGGAGRMLRRRGPESGTGGQPPAAMNLAGPPQEGPRRRMRGGPGAGPVGYGPVAEAGFFNLPQPVKAADVNVDQRVTAEEWAAATERWFLALDADRDGKLTLATLPKTPLQTRVEGARRR